MNKRKTKKIIFSIVTVAIFLSVGIFLSINGFKKPNIIKSPNPFKEVDVDIDIEDATFPVTTTAPEMQDAEVELVMVGDDLLHLSLINAHKQLDGSFNFSNIFDGVRMETESADIAIINQETLLGGTEMGLSGYPMFNSPQEAGDDIVEAGFDVVLHATNHSMDKGKDGILNTLNFWSEKHPEITVCGMNKTEKEAEEIKIVESKGIKFAILNYTEHLNGLKLPADAPYMVNLMTGEQEENIRKDIKKAKELADIVIVCPHWGTEYTYKANSNQEYWTNIFYEEGVDIVIGTHPHVVQPVEWITSEKSDHKMLVYYSLGNFVSGQVYKYSMIGAMANIKVSRINGEISVTSGTAIPLVTHYNKNIGDYGVYKLSNYTEELAKQHYISGFTLEYCKNLAEDVLDEYIQK